MRPWRIANSGHEPAGGMFIFIPANKNTSTLDHWLAANSAGIETQNFFMIT
jgi:hypothetical protein